MYNSVVLVHYCVIIVLVVTDVVMNRCTVLNRLSAYMCVVANHCMHVSKTTWKPAYYTCGNSFIFQNIAKARASCKPTK